jgi:hypothetical protein
MLFLCSSTMLCRYVFLLNLGNLLLW